jgi:hypothetical protein
MIGVTVSPSRRTVRGHLVIHHRSIAGAPNTARRRSDRRTVAINNASRFATASTEKYGVNPSITLQGFTPRGSHVIDGV